jgi:ferredoxin-nitrate reductase
MASDYLSSPFSQLDDGAAVERWVPSTCGLCSIGCGIEIAVSAQHIVGVRGRQ